MTEYKVGILILQNNRTYGQYKSNISYYKCISNEGEIIYIPYRLKNAFNKYLYNKYVVYDVVSRQNNRINGKIIEIIGDVNDTRAFNRYEIYCKKLYEYVSNKKINKLQYKINKSNIDIEYIVNKYNIRDKRHIENIYTIDPHNSVDLDDAFSINMITNNIVNVSIYIANVSIILDYLDLWNDLTERISTLYLPRNKLVMLPNILSDNICSLLENEERIVFTISINIDIINYKILEYNFSNDIIIVKKNYRYEEDELLSNLNYKYMFKTVFELNQKDHCLDKIEDSHDMIAYLMILMNYLSSRHLKRSKRGIYKTVISDKEYILPKKELPTDIQHFLKSWNTILSSYTNFEKHGRHDLLNLDSYIQITSPIRRIIDLLNLISFQQLMKVNLDKKCIDFYDKWSSKLEYINTTMKSIRHVQNNTFLINKFTYHTNEMLTLHDGFIFEREKNDENTFKYLVYLPKFKLVQSFIINNDHLEINETYKFKIFVFNDEFSLKKKIKLQIII